MTTTATRTITNAWIILSAIIIRSWRLAPGHARDAANPRRRRTLVGFINGRVIIRCFMEVRAAPRWL